MEGGFAHNAVKVGWADKGCSSCGSGLLICNQTNYIASGIHGGGFLIGFTFSRWLW